MVLTEHTAMLRCWCWLAVVLLNRECAKSHNTQTLYGFDLNVFYAQGRVPHVQIQNRYDFLILLFEPLYGTRYTVATRLATVH